MPVKAQPVQRQTNVINLMDALRRSVEGAGGKAPAPTEPGVERSAGRKAEKPSPAKKAEKPQKAEKTEKAPAKARASASKAKTRKTG
jgi:DNA end-binding protein Ku